MKLKNFNFYKFSQLNHQNIKALIPSDYFQQQFNKARMADIAANSYLASSHSSTNSQHQNQIPSARMQSSSSSHQQSRLKLQFEANEPNGSSSQLSPKNSNSPYGAIIGGGAGLGSNQQNGANQVTTASAVRAFSYYQNPQQQQLRAYPQLSPSNQTAQQFQFEEGNVANQLATLTAITDESTFEVPQKPSILSRTDQTSLISSLNQQSAQGSKLNLGLGNMIISPTQSRQTPSHMQVSGMQASGSGQIPMKGNDSAIKSLSNIKVQITSSSQSKAAVSNYHSSLAKYQGLRLAEEDHRAVSQAYGSVQSNKHKDFASLVVLSEESCKSDSKLKINTSRVADSTISHYQQVQGANSVSNIHHHIASKQHPKHSVISVGNKLSQLAQSNSIMIHSHSSNSMMIQSSTPQHNLNSYSQINNPQSIASSQSQTSLKHHISQQHQLYQQMQLLSSHNSPHPQPHLYSSSSVSQVSQNLLSSPSAQAALIVKEHQSNMNSMRASKEMLKSTGGVSDKFSSSQQNHLQQSSSVPEKRSSINSYNKRVIELHLNQHSNSKNSNLALQMPQNTLKPQMSLDISEIPEKQKTMDHLSANMQILSHSGGGSKVYSQQNSTLLSCEKAKQPAPIQSNLSPKTDNLFGSPRFSVNAVNTGVPKSKLIIRKQQNQLTQGFNSANKSGINNLSRSEQYLNLNNNTLSNCDYSHYNQGSGAIQVNQSQSISNFKQNSSPQFNKFLHHNSSNNHARTNQNSSLKKNQQFLSQQTVQLQSAPNKSQNTSQLHLLRNLSSEGNLATLTSKQLRVSESTRDLTLKNGLAGAGVDCQGSGRLIMSQNLQSALDLKRDSQRYYSPNHQISLNKALSRISSVGELKKAKQQMVTARKSIQSKQVSSNSHQVNVSGNSNLVPNTGTNSGLSTILTAHIVMQNAVNKKHQQSVGGVQNSRSKDRLLLEASGSLSKSASKAQLKSQTYSQDAYDDIANDVVNEDIEDDNEYMTNQEKLWSGIETNIDFQIIEELLKKSDVKVDAKNVFDDSWTALHYAVHEGNTPVVKLLIENHGAGVEPRSATNKTPFHLACIRGDPFLIKYLLEKGASPHVVDRDGCTPLHYLCETENHEMVRFLLPLSGPSRDVRNRFGKKPVDLIQDKEMKRILRNYSQRRESQQRITAQSSQQNTHREQFMQPHSLSRERSTSQGAQNVIQITRLNDDKEVQDQIQQMFRKFSQFQQQQLSRRQGVNSKERLSTLNSQRTLKRDESGTAASSSSNAQMFSNAASGNNTQRNLLSPQNTIADNKAKKPIKNHPSQRLTLGPSQNKHQIQIASSTSVKNIKKGTQNTKINLQISNPTLSANTSSSNLLSKNISPTKQISIVLNQTSSLASKQQIHTMVASQSQRKLNSKTPALSSVKSQAKLDISQNQLSLQSQYQNSQGGKKLASIQSVTNLLQEKHKQILQEKEKGISQTPQITSSGGLEPQTVLTNHINFLSQDVKISQQNPQIDQLRLQETPDKLKQQEESQSSSNQYYVNTSRGKQPQQQLQQQSQSNQSSSSNSGQKLKGTSKTISSQQQMQSSNKKASQKAVGSASAQQSQGQMITEYQIANNKTAPQNSGQLSDKKVQREDQGISLSQRTGDSSLTNQEMQSTSVVNKNHKLTTFSMNQLSDGNDVDEKAKHDSGKVGPSSFIAHQLLGTGSFGEVFLVEKISNGRFYAMKVLTKSKIMGHNLTRYAMTERNVMSIVNHPFIVKLNYAFQTAEKLFLILDYCPGGDLAEYLQLEKRFNEDKVRLYSSEILLALEELHRKDIIFRDLKPDNVVLDHEGHAMLTDFGLSKEGVMKEGMAKSFCGSYAYLAPEMLKKVGHGKAVDWYLLGVIIYEMLCGVPPYYANNKEELFENIKHSPLEIPPYVSPLAKDIICRLLNRNPKKRLGTFGGADEIKKHPFFKNIDWSKLFNRAYRPPEPYLRKRFDNFLQMSPAMQTNADVYEALRKQALLKNGTNLEQHVPGWSFVSPVKEQE